MCQFYKWGNEAPFQTKQKAFPILEIFYVIQKNEYK